MNPSGTESNQALHSTYSVTDMIKSLGRHQIMEGKMYFLNENEKEYRHGNHGPKYLEKGPRMNFGLVQLLP